MLDRLRRKLFLSVKVMSANMTATDDNEQSTGLKRNELMAILRKGSSAISGAGSGLSLSEFLNASIDAILQASRTHDEARTLKIKKEAGDAIKDEDETLLVDAEVEEQKLLQGVAQVQSRLFEGKVVSRAVKSNKDIAVEWQQLQKRASKARIVVIDGYEVLAEHLGPAAVCCSQTGVLFLRSADVSCSRPPSKVQSRSQSASARISSGRTGACIAATEATLSSAVLVREVRTSLCISLSAVIFTMGNWVPAVHPACDGLSKKAVQGMISFVCPQHRCCECERSTSDAGGMLFRCVVPRQRRVSTVF